ncbi:hypothetical protein Fcan01_16921 [Folsomia candida]|uniref:Uncharacterized protein n=1 Tax=Folsomia candida TaxID=158441 RepID=A0A226DSE2_FOLCA|nr:hypothetical protein Fcan01_16921 [Folsomia candida]
MSPVKPNLPTNPPDVLKLDEIKVYTFQHPQDQYPMFTTRVDDLIERVELFTGMGKKIVETVEGVETGKNMLMEQEYVLYPILAKNIMAVVEECIPQKDKTLVLYTETSWNFPGSTAVTSYNRNWLRINRPANFLLNLFPLVLWCQIIFSPHHPMHIPNIFSNYPALFYSAYFIYAPAILYSFCFVASYAKILCQTFSGLILFVLPVIEELALFRKPREFRKFKCSPELGSQPEHLVHVYRSLQFAMKEVRLVFGKYLPIIQTVMGQLAISTGYVLIAEGTKVNLAKRMTFLLCVPSAVLSWAALTTCTAKIQKSAKKCLTSWRVHGAHWESSWDRKYMAKFRKSCKPLYFGWDGLMVVTHKSVLKFIQGSIRGLFRTLLTLKKKK